jgi:hypothetical protein
MNSNLEWWEKFFKGIWQDVQPIFRTPEQTQKEADFIENVLKVKPPDQILFNRVKQGIN